MKRSFGDRHFRVKGKGRPPANIIQIAKELRKRYKDFGHYNRKNPLDELLLILCSVKRGGKFIFGLSNR